MNLLSAHSEFCFSNGDHVIKREDRFKSGRMPPTTSMFQCDTFSTSPYLGMMTFDQDDVNSSSPSPDRFSLLYHNNNNPQIFLNDSRYFNDVGVASDRNFNLNHSKLSSGLQSSYKSGNTPRKERKRTHNINSAFSALRNCIPNVPSDTKLSKIKTLRLATSYISYLMDVLSKDDPNSCGSFKAEIVKKPETRHERRKSEVHKTEANSDTKSKKSCKPSRTGWPQQVWAAEFQPEKNESFNMEQ